MVKVPVRGETLRWAMERMGLGEEDLARALGLRPERVQSWLEGKDQPTYAQAKRLAQKLHLGVPQLLVPPLEVRLPLPDFRRCNRGSPPSPELLEAIYDALRKRDWWQEHRAKPLPFVGRGRERPPGEVGAEIRRTFRIGELQKEARDPRDFLHRLVEEVEKEGILVLRQGHVGANTRRTYNPEEFSGFSLVEEEVCLIFINAQDPPARQVFTLVHELAHVWWGEGGLENRLEADPAPDTPLETWADAVAAEALGYRDLPKPQMEGRREGSYSLEARNSPTLVRTLRQAYWEGEADLKDVALLLNLTPSQAARFLRSSRPLNP